MKSKDITQHLDVGRVQVSRWRERCAQSLLGGIERDLPRAAGHGRCGGGCQKFCVNGNLAGNC